MYDGSSELVNTFSANPTSTLLLCIFMEAYLLDGDEISSDPAKFTNLLRKQRFCAGSVFGPSRCSLTRKERQRENERIGLSPMARAVGDHRHHTTFAD